MAQAADALVAIALARRVIQPLRQAGRLVPGLLVVDSCEGAARVIQMLRAGFSPAEVAYPPLFTPDRLLMAAANQTGENYQVRFDPRPVNDGDLWITLEGDTVVVASQNLTPLEVAAVQGRQGLPKADRQHLLIGPCNWAGQGAAWANAVQQHVAGFEGRNLTIGSTNQLGPPFISDVSIDATLLEMPLTRIDLALDVVAPATHVMIEDMYPVLHQDRQAKASMAGLLTRREIEMIKASGREVAVVIHGTAGRRPHLHAAMYPLSPFADSASRMTESCQDLCRRIGEGLAGLDVPVFVATLDMLDYVPGATWLPIVIGEADFAPPAPWEPSKRLRVLHAPSNDSKKGSRWVDQTLERLDQLGVIEYQRLSGVHPQLIPGLLRQVDVVVDQVTLGNVATLANQTMAAGRLSLGLLSPHVRQRYPVDPPILNVDPTTLGDVVWEIAKDPQRFEAQAVAGPAFARQVHDGRLAARVLSPWLLGSAEGGDR